MLEKLPMILKFTLNSLNSVALLTTNKRESDQHSLSFFVSQRTWWRGHLSPFTQHHDLRTKLIWSTIKEDCMRFFIYYLTFYSFVLLHVLSGVLTKPYVATVTNQTRICAKTENMIVCRTYIIRCNIRDVHVKMRWWISSNL